MSEVEVLCYKCRQVNKKTNKYCINCGALLGENLEIIFPIDENLKRIVPKKDKILCSTMAKGIVTVSVTSKRVTNYEWTTPLLLTDNGVAFFCPELVSSRPIHYLPWGFVKWVKPRIGRTIIVKQEAGDFKYSIVSMKPAPDTKMGRKRAWEYFDRFKLIWEQRLAELEEKIVRNIINLEPIPKYEFYVVDFDFVPKSKYKNAVKLAKKLKKSSK